MTSRTQWTLFVCCLVLLEISAAADVTDGAPRSSENRSSLVEASSISDLKRALLEQQGLLLSMQNAMVELQSTVVKLQSTVAELQSSAMGQNATCGATSTSEAASTVAPVRISGSGGATYIRWGRTSCPGDVELVYKGYVGGSHYSHKGAAVDNLCLPEDPQYRSYTAPRDIEINYVYGAEYESYSRLPYFRNQNQDIPCAVCRIPTRSTVLTIPAKYTCPSGYHREYHGYLMAGTFYYEAASQFACVDSRPENLAGGNPNHDGKLFYFVKDKCGSLRCPPYVGDRELTCVVCSK